MGYFSDRKYWGQWFPADFVVEALPGQFRNWFYALLAVSTMMVGRSPFKVLKGHGLVLDDEGKPMHKSEGNAIWFDEAAEQFGVDVMRWLYAATSPERNVLFGPKHCDETRREVILPWWNVYSFFCNLARVDDFKPARHRASPDDRSMLDRWIISDLHRLIGIAREAYGSFDVDRFCGESRRFVDVLSTWYVRRSRRRFYGPEWSSDKLAAYSTLYDVLVTFNRMVAPIIPFMSETIHQNLVARQGSDSPASVHHVPFPNADASLIDESLSAHVAASIRLVSLGRFARKDSKLKIRQPLAEMIVVPGDESERRAVELFEADFTEELNVKKLTLRDHADDLVQITVEPNMKTIGAKFGRLTSDAKAAIAVLDGAMIERALQTNGSYLITVGGTTTALFPEDLIVRRTFSKGWAGAADGKSLVLLDTRVTPELKNEGVARDIIRNVQNLRKDAGLEIADRITLSLTSESPDVLTAIEQFRDYIAGETLAVEVSNRPLRNGTQTATVEFDDPKENVTVVLAKV
jgi:isoleucyl-tRNA synthetase